MSNLNRSTRRLSGQTVFLLAVVAASIAIVGYLFVTHENGMAETDDSRSPMPLVEFDGQPAYDYLKQICELGPRPSGSAGMTAQQELLVAHFTKLGATVNRQEFRIRDPRDGSPVEMANLIVTWHPEQKRRIALCTHYDTKPFPDQDPRNPRGTFIGANDGASGTALLMALGESMPNLESKYGVDFIFFDGEEYVFSDRDAFFLGSQHFAADYVNNRPQHRYRYGVLLDMIGDKDLQLYHEIHSIEWRDTRPLVLQIWGVAKRLGIKEFIPRAGHRVRDDHLAMRNIAKIPTCDIIDFDYPAWHTEQDVPEQCSAESLEKVGRVILAWLSTTK